MIKVQVFMSTYNGSQYLEEQIESIINQVGVEVTLIVRDDGSNDDTLDILEKYYKEKKLKYYTGTNLGYCRSFLHLITQATKSDYYAFADQDDVWEQGKLLRAVESLEKEKIPYNDKPMLYASALTYVDKELNFIKKGEFKNLHISLGSALVRQRLAGCTMVFNNSLLSLCSKCFNISDIKFGHDGWVYLICLATGGSVIYDNNSYIKYRRHGDNQTVSGNGIVNRIRRELYKFSKLKDTQYNAAIKIRDNFQEYLTDEAKDILDDVIYYKESYIKTIKLAFNKKIKCGVEAIDIINKIIILFRCF